MDDIERIGSIKYEEFFRSYLEANQLCIFSSELTKHWRSRNEWVSNGRPNLEFLSKTFGKSWCPSVARNHLSLNPWIQDFLELLCLMLSRFARDVTAAMLVAKNKSNSFLWELNSIFM